MPSRTAASDSRRRLWFTFFVLAASRQSSLGEKSVRNFTADAMARILPAPGNHLKLDEGIPHESKREAAGIIGFKGVLQVDGYAGHRALAEKGGVELAFCWSHVRRRFYELAAAGPAPIANEALERIAALYAIEKDIRGRSADERRAVRPENSRPIIDDLEAWLRGKLDLVSQKSKLAEAIRYALARWAGLARFIEDGRIDIDSNVVERSIRPIALNRKNALFAGSDGGGEHWTTVASLIETCKLSGVEPNAYLADVITRIVNGRPNSQIDDLLPWAYAPAQDFKGVA
jgi:hypothetical protein